MNKCFSAFCLLSGSGNKNRLYNGAGGDSVSSQERSDRSSWNWPGPALAALRRCLVYKQWWCKRSHWWALGACPKGGSSRGCAGIIHHHQQPLSAHTCNRRVNFRVCKWAHVMGAPQSEELCEWLKKHIERIKLVFVHEDISLLWHRNLKCHLILYICIIHFRYVKFLMCRGKTVKVRLMQP